MEYLLTWACGLACGVGGVFGAAFIALYRKRKTADKEAERLTFGPPNVPTAPAHSKYREVKPIRVDPSPTNNKPPVV